MNRAIEALQGLLDEWDRNTCTHEETHRGGFIWTICDGCGMKWADDEDGFKPYEDPPKVAKARKVVQDYSRPHIKLWNGLWAVFRRKDDKEPVLIQSDIKNAIAWLYRGQTTGNWSFK